MKELSEAAIQASCVKWLWNKHPETRNLFFAVRNEDDGIGAYDVIAVLKDIILKPLLATSTAKRYIASINAKKARRGGVINAMGRISGVSDTVLLWNSKTYLIEFKDEKGKQSPKQREWEAITAKNGFNYFIIRDLCSFQKLITNILNYDKEMA